ncbi:MAG: hypothetical protein ACJ74J_06180 [Blastocatellia bacterium]
MTLFCKLSRKHYWCTPHRTDDRRLVQVCYECGAERPARELHIEEVPAGLAARPVKGERPLRHRNDPHAGIGQPVLSHLTLVK